MTNKHDVYEKITAEIIEAIEAGCSTFQMPWHTLGIMPSNACTGGRYRGINVLALWAASQQKSYRANLWATYQQWSELGAQVRQAEKSTAVVFWKFFGADEQTDTETESNEDPGQRSSRCLARAYHVFNADQVDSFVLPDVPLLPESQRIEAADDFFRRTGISIVEGGSRAYYNSVADQVHMPAFSLFKRAECFYSVLGHEAVHAVGHVSRCHRKLGNRFGTEAYAAEELIAEIGSAFLAAELGLATEPRMDHAPYVKNWLRVLKNDNRAIFTAASKAQHAVDWLLAATVSRGASRLKRLATPPLIEVSAIPMCS